MIVGLELWFYLVYTDSDFSAAGTVDPIGSVGSFELKAVFVFINV